MIRLVVSGFSEAGPVSGISRLNSVPGSMSSKEDLARGWRKSDLGVKIINCKRKQITIISQKQINRRQAVKIYWLLRESSIPVYHSTLYYYHNLSEIFIKVVAWPELNGVFDNLNWNFRPHQFFMFSVKG